MYKIDQNIPYKLVDSNINITHGGIRRNDVSEKFYHNDAKQKSLNHLKKKSKNIVKFDLTNLENKDNGYAVFQKMPVSKNTSASNYNLNIKSIKGSGTVTPDLRTNPLPHNGVVKKTFNKNLRIIPPLYTKNIIAVPPIKTSGYLNQNNYVVVPNKIDKYYYPTQQLDTVLKKNAKSSSILNFPPPLINSLEFLINSEKISAEKKDKKKNKKKNKDDENVGIDFTKRDNELLENTDSISNTLINKKFYNDRYLYTFEPRYNDVIKPQRSYTLMYPFTPNLDNYYVDNINSSKGSPIILNSQENFSETSFLRNSTQSIEIGRAHV